MSSSAAEYFEGAHKSGIEKPVHDSSMSAMFMLLGSSLRLLFGRRV